MGAASSLAEVLYWAPFTICQDPSPIVLIDLWHVALGQLSIQVGFTAPVPDTKHLLHDLPIEGDDQTLFLGATLAAAILDGESPELPLQLVKNLGPQLNVPVRKELIG